MASPVPLKVPTDKAFPVFPVILKNETEIATKTGYFALPLNRVVTANEIVTLIVATVTMAIVKTKKPPHQQLVTVKRPSSPSLIQQEQRLVPPYRSCNHHL